MNKGTGPSDRSTRNWLAVSIVGLSIIGIAVASGIAIVFASAADRPEMSRLVFSSVLPLFGTWVGTVLAFYFARENLEAATDSTLRLSGRVDPSTPVTQVMIAKDQIVSYDLAAGEDPKAVSLTELAVRMSVPGKTRLPIFDTSGKVVFIVYQTTLDAFAKSHGGALAANTVNDLLNDPALGPLLKALAFVGPDAVLADARAKMRAVTNCSDVFVTTTGTQDGTVTGWLTNTVLASET